MTTDDNIMEEMLERATNPSRDSVDELGVQMFCMVARNNVHKAQEMLVSKIRSRNVTESVRAIELLEDCMSKCGTEFQDEVSKFRFLNDLIRLVSKKYQGAETPAPIKQRLMECLLLWTTEFPQKSKIREAYDNLNKEGGVDHGNSPAVVSKKESILGIDEEMLSKLINSGDPENFKRANLLIQWRVNQEARRTELRVQQKSELQEVGNTVSLLNQMLDTYEADDGQPVEEGSETMNLIRELYMACKRHKPILQRLLEMFEQTDEELTADTLESNDLLLAVMKRYKSVVVHPTSKEETTPTNTVKLQPAKAAAAAANKNADLLAELLGDAPAPAQTPAAPLVVANGAVPVASSNTTKATSKTLEELNEIFGNLSNAETVADGAAGDLFVNLELLEPVNVFGACEVKTTAAQTAETAEQQLEKRGFRELREIDVLSEQLFKQSLPAAERVGSFKKDADKVTLNDLVKEKLRPVASPSKTSGKITKMAVEESDQMLDLKGQTVKPSSANAASAAPEDELMLTTSNDSNTNATTISLKCNVKAEKSVATEQLLPSVAAETTSSATHLGFKHLSDIAIELDDVTPTAEERLLMDDDDVKITLNFTTNRPSRHVSVIVISVLSKSKLAVNDFQFEASVKKPSKIRLLTPTGTQMPPYKPFRPPAPINQVMLLFNPTGQAVDVTCIVGYKLGDDPDAIKESIVAKHIPYVE